MPTEPRLSAGLTRRGLVAVGTSWVFGSAGLLLPASMDEAAARGALGGAIGGRRGKNHRGRNKDRNAAGKSDDTRNADDGGYKGVAVVCENGSSFPYKVGEDTDPDTQNLVDVGGSVGFREHNLSAIHLSFSTYSGPVSPENLSGIIGFSVRNHADDSGKVNPEVLMYDLNDYDGTVTQVSPAEQKSFDFHGAAGQLFRVERQRNEIVTDDDEYFTSFKVTAL